MRAGETTEVSAPAPRAGAYVTDGSRLFRVITPLLATTEPEVALLEDCMSLDVRAFTPAELWEMQLIRVTPLASVAR